MAVASLAAGAASAGAFGVGVASADTLPSYQPTVMTTVVGSGSLSDPQGIAVSGPSAFIADELYTGNGAANSSFINNSVLGINMAAGNTLVGWGSLGCNGAGNGDSSSNAVALSPDGNTLYFTCDAGGQESIDADNLQTGAFFRITNNDFAGSTAGDSFDDPDGLAVSPNGDDLYIADAGNGGGNGNVFVADVSGSDSGEVIGAIDFNSLISVPVGLAVSPDGKTLYIANDIPSSQVMTANVAGVTSTAVPEGTAVEGFQSLSLPHELPNGVAVSPDGATLYVSYSGAFGGGVDAIDTSSDSASGHDLGSVATGFVPGGVGISPDGSALYVSDPAGPDMYSVAIPSVLAAPQIAGTVAVGHTLTASSSDPEATYQWYADGNLIANADTTTLALTSSLVGDTITVAATPGSDLAAVPGYSLTPATSSATVAVADGTLSAGSVSISGVPKVGIKLRAVAGIWGPGTVALSYRWKADGKLISGATGSTLVVAAADAGRKLTVTVSGSESAYTSASVTSSSTAAVAKAALIANAPKIAGAARQGATLKVKVAAWKPAAVKLTYQWYAGVKKLGGATSSTLKLTAALVGRNKLIGKRLEVKVTGTKVGYTTITKSSAETSKVAK